MSSYDRFCIITPKSFLALFQSSNLLLIGSSSSSESRSLWRFLTNLPSFCRLFLISLRLSRLMSIGLHPLQLQSLQPLTGSVALLYSLGTWQRQLFPDFEKAFIHSLQQPFFMTNLSNFSSSGRLESPASTKLSSYTGSPMFSTSTLSHSVATWLCVSSTAPCKVPWLPSMREPDGSTSTAPSVWTSRLCVLWGSEPSEGEYVMWTGVSGFSFFAEEGKPDDDILRSNCSEITDLINE